jgi:hypothetical protein
MYGVPQPGTYGQYGFGAYPASPGGAAAGMPQPAAGAAAGQTAPGADVGVVGQAAPAQWTGDPSSYYSNYWGGKRSASGFPCSLQLTGPGAFFLGYYPQQTAPGQQGATDVPQGH